MVSSMSSLSPVRTVVVALLVVGGVATAAEGRFEEIFDGKSLKGWSGTREWWHVADGCIVGEIPKDRGLKRNEFLFWEGELHDFDLRLKYRVTGNPRANSGVQFRSQRHGRGAKGYQADIDHGTTWAGRIYDEHGRGLIVERGAKVLIDAAGKRTVSPFKPAKDFQKIARKNEWNDYRIRAVGTHIQVWLNGELTADLTDNQLGQTDLSGLLALQLHSGPADAKIEFKEFRLQHLGKTEPPKGRPPMKKIDPVLPASRDGVSPKGRNLGFEDGTLKGWKAEGEVWRGGPIKGDTVTARGRGQASGHMGQFWVGGFERTKSDRGQGTLTSDPFKVTHPWASFLVGGGDGKTTRVELVDADSGAVIFTASGKRRETMAPVWADLRRHRGKMIRIKVIDESSGAWGHVNFDDFRFHEKKAASKPARMRTSRVLQHLVPNSDGDDEVTKSMWVPKGFKVERIAMQPTVTQPIAFTFDERGRIWIAEAHAYPERRPEGKGEDRIIILEDANGDGSFETKKTFAKGLNLVSGLEVGFGGVWVGAAPHLLFIPDQDHDDVPDGEPRLLLDGWGYQDTHETLNSFIWGPDGWLYGNQGVFCRSSVGKPGAPPQDRVNMRAGVWRYHPKKHKFEIFAEGGSNQWGIDFNEFGHLFITHCRSSWGGGPTTYVIKNGRYWNQANNYHAPFVSAGPAGYRLRGRKPFQNFLLSSAGYGHGEGGAGARGSRAVYGGHSHVGTMIYLGENWPARFRNQLFTHNLHGHQMNRQINRRRGSGYETVHSGSDQLHVPSPEFIGVDLKYGPDGAVYFIDWADRQHCHNRNTEVWNRTDGGVFRMAWAKTYSPKRIDLRAVATAKLVELVTSRNEWISRTARRLLQERGDRSAVAPLQEIFANSPDKPSVIRALWALQLLGETPASALQHPAEEVRAWTVQFATEDKTVSAKALNQLAAKDSSAMVRLAIASALPELPAGDRWAVGATLAVRAEDATDPFLPKMIWFGIADSARADIPRALSLAKRTPMKILAESIAWYLSRSEEGRNAIVAQLADGKSVLPPERTLRLMTESLAQSRSLSPPDRWAAVDIRYRSAATATDLDTLGALFGHEGVLAGLRKILVDRKQPASKRLAAFRSLREHAGKESVETFVGLLGEAKFRREVIPALARFNDPRVSRSLIALVPKLKGRELSAALSALSAQPVSATAMLHAVKRGDISRSALNSLYIRQMQSLGNREVDTLLAEVWGRVNQSSVADKEKIAKYLKLFEEAPTWAHKQQDGKAVYTRLCAGCHVLKGEGNPIGPDLTGAGANGAHYFIENIVDPNSVVGENFQFNAIMKKDGSVVTGAPAAESKTTLTIRTLEGVVTIAKSDIKTRQVLEQSMMPPGLLDTLKNKEIVDLLLYLTRN